MNSNNEKQEDHFSQIHGKKRTLALLRMQLSRAGQNAPRSLIDEIHKVERELIDLGGSDRSTGENSSSNQFSHMLAPAAQVTPAESPAPAKKSGLLITIPSAIGRFVLDIFGRDKAADLSAIILGYITIILALAIALGIISPATFVNLFTFNWRFFFPVK
jgi:hypothetical protein